MIVFDTEATALTQPEVSPVEQQPYLLEFAGFKLHEDTLVVEEELVFLCRPPIPIPPEVVKITGLTDADVAGASSFVTHYPRLVDFFLGQRTMVAHNVSYDANVLRSELRRIDRERRFPWPPDWRCTVELTQHLTGKFLSLVAAYEALTGAPAPHVHRARADAELLVTIVRRLRQDGVL